MLNAIKQEIKYHNLLKESTKKELLKAKYIEAGNSISVMLKIEFQGMRSNVSFSVDKESPLKTASEIAYKYFILLDEIKKEAKELEHQKQILMNFS